MNPPSKWEDLRPRIISGAALAAVGVVCIALGGFWFHLLAAISSGIMVWELFGMISAGQGPEALGLGALAFLAVYSTRWLGPWALIPVLLPAGLGWYLAPRDREICAAFALGICLAGFGLITFRDGYGVVWLVWLILVVVATDISGYFAGRALGGPKFWPAISPKKTWSGTAAGWISAAVIGLIFLLITDAGRDLIWISAAVAFASQMGDIAESAVKRRCGVKDSSNLIPGHGGLFDRFDGLLGASLAMLAVALVVDVPQLRF
jgi:phosphatidate cytidylyltransferase